ncbi:MAG TPA: hypothetical protein VM070_03010 [Candidatus Saccharimonadales bacterium]|nr:hypothetical protein [Candidatus Saccharimonadales bacterium]
MAIAIQIPFPRPAARASGDHPRRAVSITARPGARIYSPYGRRRLAGPMAVPYAGAAAERASGGRRRLPFFRARRG